jgi:thiamine-phosphate pyrophosphorylase
MNPVDLRLYGILGPENTDGRDLASCVTAAVAGGATLIQLRDKFSDSRALVESARSLMRALAGSGVPLLINDRVDVALAAGADGVHLGQKDMRAVDARRLLGPGKIIGITLNHEDQARALSDEDVDYACIGGVFATTSKDNPNPPVGLAGLARIADLARAARPGLPVGAIAGIDRTNLRGVIGAGADGIAVISALFAPEDIPGAARDLRLGIDEALAARGVAGNFNGETRT